MASRGLSATELAKMSGVHYVLIRSYLRGDRKQGKFPSLKSLIALARALKCSLEDLTGLESLRNIEKKAEAVKKLTEEEKALLDAYESLSDSDWRKKAVQEILLKTKEESKQGKAK